MSSISNTDVQEFLDAVEMLYGSVVSDRISGWAQEDPKRLSTLPQLSVQAAIAALSGALGDPETAAFRYEDGDEPWPDFLWLSAAWNPFPGNVTALALLAVVSSRIVVHSSHKEAYGAHELAQESVAYYLAWTDQLIRTKTSHIHLNTEGFLEKTKAGRADQVAAKIVSLANDLVGQIPKASKLAESIGFIINAMLVLREKREERAPLTFDLELPLIASWQLLWRISSDGGLDGESAQSMAAVDDLLTELKPKQATLIQASAGRLSLMVRRMQDGAKLLGRGVAEIMFRADEASANMLGPMELSKLYTSHDGAPLSLLYSLGWRHPNHESYDKDVLPRVRIVLHGSGAVSITNSNDPLLEFFSGGWRYVDLDSKTDIILSNLEAGGTSLDREGIYRLFRFSHHLGSHHHGATVAVSSQASLPSTRMKEFWDQWGVEGRLEESVNSAQAEFDVGFDKGCVPLMFNGNTKVVRTGRLAYCMALHDGMTTVGVKPDKDAFQVTDFRDFPGFDKKTIDADREAVEGEAKITLPRKLDYGSRHRAAFIHSRDEGIDVVLCISQDGFITAFIKGVPLQVR